MSGPGAALETEGVRTKGGPRDTGCQVQGRPKRQRVSGPGAAVETEGVMTMTRGGPRDTGC